MSLLADGRYAAIDIGTVTTRMLLAEVRDGQLHELGRRHRITNLGEGVDATGRLAPQAIGRVVAALRDNVDSMKAQGLNPEDFRMKAVATSAARDAENGDEFVAAVDELGLGVQIIEGWQEGAYTYQGVSADFGDEALAVLDIGGGSSELIIGGDDGAPALLHSFNVGSRRLTERHLPDDPPSPADYDRVREVLIDQMAPRLTQMISQSQPLDRLVAVAGTATSVVSVRDAMEVYDPARVHRARVSRAQLMQVIEKLAYLPIVRRAQVTGLEPARAPVIVAGMIILETVLDLAGFDEFTVSESDLLHGLVISLARRDETP